MASARAKMGIFTLHSKSSEEARSSSLQETTFFLSWSFAPLALGWLAQILLEPRFSSHPIEIGSMAAFNMISTGAILFVALSISASAVFKSMKMEAPLPRIRTPDTIHYMIVAFAGLILGLSDSSDFELPLWGHVISLLLLFAASTSLYYIGLWHYGGTTIVEESPTKSSEIQRALKVRPPAEVQHDEAESAQ